MSWDACLEYDIDGHTHEVFEQNYTHNCNRMMAAVLEDAGHKLESHWLIGHMGKTWFHVLDGLNGAKGYELLDIIVTGLEADPARFEAMNPENVWGSYARVLTVLRKMRDVSKEYPSCKWRVSG
jgi:hypothetical protein